MKIVKSAKVTLVDGTAKYTAPIKYPYGSERASYHARRRSGNRTFTVTAEHGFKNSSATDDWTDGPTQAGIAVDKRSAVGDTDDINGNYVRFKVQSTAGTTDTEVECFVTTF